MGAFYIRTNGATLDGIRYPWIIVAIALYTVLLQSACGIIKELWRRYSLRLFIPLSTIVLWTDSVSYLLKAMMPQLWYYECKRCECVTIWWMLYDRNWFFITKLFSSNKIHLSISKFTYHKVKFYEIQFYDETDLGKTLITRSRS